MVVVIVIHVLVGLWLYGWCLEKAHYVGICKEAQCGLVMLVVMKLIINQLGNFGS